MQTRGNPFLIIMIFMVMIIAKISLVIEAFIKETLKIIERMD
jgi:hypothetical protein